MFDASANASSEVIQARTSQVLHGLSALRHWLLAQLPPAPAPAGGEPWPSLAADLFLELAEQWAEGRQPTLDQLALEMAYPREQLAAQLTVMARAGLLAGWPAVQPPAAELVAVPLAGAAAGPVAGLESARPLQPTPAFEGLLAAYEGELQARFIPREPLRNEQLFVDCQDAALAAEVRLLYDRCFDLGWLYLHRYGATCFMMAIVLQMLFARRGHRAHVQIGELVVQHEQRQFVLGRQPTPTPGRIDAHACCVVDDRLVVDFGLGNVRRHHRKNFFWGMASDRMRLGQAVLAETGLPDGGVVRWTSTGQAPVQALQLEVQRCRQLLPVLLQEHDQRYRWAGETSA